MKEEIPNMFEHFSMIFQMIWESLTAGKLMDILHDQLWNQRIAVPVEMDLTTLRIQSDLFKELENSCFTEITLDKIQASDWCFTTPSRRHKAIRNLKRGLRGFALIKDSQVVGDIWCVIPSGDGNALQHPHLNMLGIQPKAKAVYSFDMMIAPAFRGKHLATPIQRAVHLTLKAEGYSILYAFYWQENIPAMWMHRTLKYKELPKRWISRFFFVKRFGYYH